MEKSYVLDTSTLLDDPNSIEILADKDNAVIIPICAYEELEKFKEGHNGRSYNAREVFRILDELRVLKSFKTGVRTKLGGIVYINTEEIKKFPEGMSKSNDNRIILLALKLKARHPEIETIVVSRDRALRVKADALGVKSQDYQNTKVVKSVDELYSGYAKIPLLEEDDWRVTSELYDKSRVVAADELKMFDASRLMPNQCCEFVAPDGKKTILAIFKATEDGGKFTLVHKPKDWFGKGSVGPINNEQAFADALIRDIGISLVAFIGKAGTGKTLIALNAACDLIGTERCDQIIVYRPNTEVGERMGFLPGDIKDKFQPFMYPIGDNLARIFNKPSKSDRKKGSMAEKKMGCFDAAAEFMENGGIAIEPINFIRGRSLHNKTVIVDECQNLTPHEVKTLITRAGENTKIILTGDPSQIDKPFMDYATNALSYVTQRFMGQPCFGCITFVKGERSSLAEKAADLL